MEPNHRKAAEGKGVPHGYPRDRYQRIWGKRRMLQETGNVEMERAFSAE